MVVTEPYDWVDDPKLSAEEILTRFRACDLMDGCQYCGVPFDVIAYRYLCPHCHAKNTCCE